MNLCDCLGSNAVKKISFESTIAIFVVFDYKYLNFILFMSLKLNFYQSGKDAPVGKFFKEEALKEIMKITSAEVGDSIFFTCGKISKFKKYLL